MNIQQTPIGGCWQITPSVHRDARGAFVKPFARTELPAGIFDAAVEEMYYSTSARGVVRGMHFQSSPIACLKFVTCLSGSVFDVLLDLRKGSATFGNTYALNLSAATGNAVVVPAGVAHGFQSLEDSSIVSYLQSAPFDDATDAGVHYSSIGVLWPEPISHVSLRDLHHPPFQEFVTPFV